MMRLSNIEKVSETVDRGSWTGPLSDSIIALWGGEPGRCWYWRSSANHVFKADIGGVTRWLRFNTDDERSLSEIESELAVIHWFAAQGMRVSEPVPSMAGRSIETVETVAGTCHAVLFTHVDGEMWDTDDLDTEGHGAWGRALGRYHALSKRMPRGIADARPGWRDHLAFIREYIPSDDIGLLHACRELGEWLEDLPTDEGSYGLVHYDFDLDNVAWKDGEAGILDFDDSARYPYAADIANALAHLREDDPKAIAFLEGYSAETDVPMGYAEQARNLKRLQALYKYARVTRAVDTEDETLEASGGSMSLRRKLLEGRERNRGIVLTGGGE